MSGARANPFRVPPQLAASLNSSEAFDIAYSRYRRKSGSNSDIVKPTRMTSNGHRTVQFRCKTQTPLFDLEKWVLLRDGGEPEQDACGGERRQASGRPLSPTTPLGIARLPRVLW
jgi:hypothetical protein